ncbi:MAG: 3-dehydroquinate synthase [Xanthomonadales bacterium]|nr:3-dehydroquinate synthase [Xanthomonadales bacterium]
MQTVRVDLADRSYTVHIGAGLLNSGGAVFEPVQGSMALVVSNETVAPLYLDTLTALLKGADVQTLVLPDGESYKTLETWSKIIDRLVELRATRDTTIITLGGGVVGDIGGFASASYMRGINFIQVPTSLLAQVDASVGGKTGVNHPRGKNLVGAFHQPTAVLIDINTLDTLPGREFSAGLAEVVKIAAVRDTGFLAWLEDSHAAIMARNPGTVTRMIERSIVNKATIVSEDEREAGIRALLNFGHSFAHAFETLTGYQQYLHGEAVAIGMMVAARLSEIRGLCDNGISQRLAGLLTAFGLPLEVPAKLDSEQILATMKLDKKVLGGQARLVLLESAGHGLIDSDSKTQQVIEAIEASRA